MNEKRILTVYLYDTKHAELRHLMEDVDEQFKPVFVAKYGIEKRFGVVKQLYGNFVEVFKPEIGSPLTEDINQDDKGRDTQFSGVCNAIDGFAKSGSPEEKQQAAILNRMVSKYRKVNSLPLMENTAEIFAFIKETRKAPYAEIVDFLRLTSIIDELERLNKNFQTNYNQRSTENLSKKQEASLTEIKYEWIPAFRIVAERINARYSVALDDEETEVIAELGNFIDQINAIMLALYRVLSRRGKKINKKVITLALGGATDFNIDEFEDEDGDSSEGISL